MNGSYRYFESKSFYVQSASEAWCRLVLLTVCLTLSTGLFAQDITPCDSGSLKPNAGAGIETNPYKICNIQQLQNITTLTAHYVLVTDIDASTTKDLNGDKGFAPIGATYSTTGLRTDSPDSPGFSGAFDGGGYRISNLFIDRPVEEGVGLFAFSHTADIKNLTFSTAKVTGRTRVGILAGHALQSTISGITVTGSVVTGSSTGRTRVGTLAGRALHGTISDIAVTNSVVAGGELVGGVIGEFSGIGASLSAARVTASTITGQAEVGGVAGYLADARISTVRVTDSTIGAEREGGGVAGSVGGGIQGSEAIGIVVTGSEEDGGKELGGLVGHLIKGGVIRQSYATGVVGDPERDYEVGGLVGHVREGALVENSYAWVRVGGDGSVGGLVGVNQSTISNSYAYSVVTPRNPSALTGLSIFVGLNGQAGADIQSVEQGGTIEGSYAAGTVNGEIPTTLTGDNSGTITGSSTRTLLQLRCPTASSRFCAEGEPETFAGWDSDIWYFGSTHTLPVLKALTRIPAVPTDVSLEWSTTNSLVLRSASTPDVTYYELGLEVGESSTVLLARSPNFELGDLSRELRGNLAGGDSVSYTVRVSSETRVVNSPSGDGNENTQIVTEIVSPPLLGSFILLDVPGTLAATQVQVTTGVTTIRVTVNAPDNDGYGRKATDTTTYGSIVDKVDLNFAYVVSVIDGGGNSVSSMTRVTTEASVMIDLAGLRAGTQYRIVTFVQNVVGAGGAYEGGFTTGAGVPEVPVIASVWEGTQRLVLSWTAPYDGGSTITAYEVTVGGSTEAESTTRLDSDSTMRVVDSTVLSSIRSISRGGDKIPYSVRAINAIGDGVTSVAEFTLLDVPGTLAATQVQVTTGVTTVRVTVNAPDNDGYGRKATDTTTYGSIVDKVDLNFAYVVSVIDGGGNSVSSMTRVTTEASVMIDLAGLRAGTQYRIVTFVQNVVGAGVAYEGGFTTGAGVPEAPVIASVWEGTQRLVLSWTAPHHGGSTIMGYEVTVGGSTEAESTTRLDSDSTMRVVDSTVLSSIRSISRGGDKIPYSVRAINAIGDGVTSVAEFTLLDVPGTLAATQVQVTTGVTTVRVTVNAPDNDGYGRKATDTTTYGSIVDKVDLNFAYVVSVIDGGGNSVSSMTRVTTEASVMIDLAGLRAGTQYRIVTFVQNVVGAGVAYEGGFTTGAGVPEAPVIASVWEGTQRLVLSWTAPHHGGSTIMGYEVTVGGSTEAESTTRLDSDSTMRVVDSTVLSSIRSISRGGDKIPYSVRAINAIGDGVTSVAEFTLLDVPGTLTATQVQVTTGVTTVRVTVNAPDNDGYGRKATDTTTYGSIVDKVDLNFAYVVSVIDGGGNSVSSMTRVTTEASVMIDLAGLRAGTQYRIVTLVQNAVGSGGANEGGFTTGVGVPEAPVIASVWEGTQRLVLSWTAPHHGGSTITAYVVTVGGSTEAESTTRLDSDSTMRVVDSTVLSSIRSISRGGDKIPYSVRAINAIGDGVPSVAEFTLLDVPGTLAATQVQVTTGVTTVRVTVNATDNDGYGRKATDTTTYGSIVDKVELDFAYVVSVIDGGGNSVSSMTETTTATSVTLVLNGLKAGTRYQIVAFVQNAVGPGGTHEEGFTTGGTSAADRVRLRLRGYLGGAVR